LLTIGHSRTVPTYSRGRGRVGLMSSKVTAVMTENISCDDAMGVIVTNIVRVHQSVAFGY